jgi:hypothetical protein
MPIANPPFHVVEAWPIVNNTQGGLSTTSNSASLEISSIYGHLIWKQEYHGMFRRRTERRGGTGLGTTTGA